MHPSPTERVAANVRAAAARKRASQAEIGAVIGISQAAVSQRLLGRVDFKSLELVKLADYFGTTPAALIDVAGRFTQVSGRPQQLSTYGELGHQPGREIVDPLHEASPSVGESGTSTVRERQVDEAQDTTASATGTDARAGGVA
ncbi:helix-turn-helix transcriptional regulator [Nocardia sp. NPDC051911]|uniref:helix-turn-helix domain-containing protein n=1 Tax=Nocardia sp. NPDC051911 TaxID=3154648 RepID=UPI003415FB6C